TGPVPLCGPFPTRVPPTTAYTKPLVILINEYSSGPAEFFAAMLQDAGRGVLFGAPTAGSGSVGDTYNAGSYGEDGAIVSVALAVRSKTVMAPGFPATNLIEDVGVQPDIFHDVFTIENLRQFGAPYVGAFTAALLSRIDGT
ncbi:MAG TPA: S41 family peptidase, partial [Candidatus Solibacter sp.]|nr:S41 family peptidase [Candidatus Solibacter sp.]